MLWFGKVLRHRDEVHNSNPIGYKLIWHWLPFSIYLTSWHNYSEFIIKVTSLGIFPHKYVLCFIFKICLLYINIQLKGIVRFALVGLLVLYYLSFWNLQRSNFPGSLCKLASEVWYFETGAFFCFFFFTKVPARSEIRMTLECCSFPNFHQVDKWALFCRNKKVGLQ